MTFSPVSGLGLLIVFSLIIPIAVHSFYSKQSPKALRGRPAAVISLIMKYLSMVLMVAPAGLKELGFPSISMLLLYIGADTFFLLCCWITWAVYFKKPSPKKEMLINLFMFGIFFCSGLAMRHHLLAASSVLYIVFFMLQRKKDGAES